MIDAMDVWTCIEWPDEKRAWHIFLEIRNIFIGWQHGFNERCDS